MIQRILSVSFLLASAMPAIAQEKAVAPEAIEFFEKKIRPALVEHCYECHSAKAKKIKGGLLLDSRAGVLEGGDNGPAIVPGNPDKSRLIEAIRYTNVDLKMPKKSKLPDAVIADFAAWVKMGAAWPDEKQAKKSTYNDFNLAKRKAEHWCWRPICADAAPEVKDKDWARTDADRFLLAKLEAKGLKPAPAADPRTLIRRLYFDIVGLPPAREEVESFVKAWDGAGTKRGEVLGQVVDRLLDSPQFGERWARHWLDLVRYAESRGHEFDYTIPNAHHYRDYVIRALNSDVPYNQFVHEHLAGDLLKNPRLHPKDGFNESILGTAFWFLGEEVHSPVDIRQDQADRFDNRIDVMTKTFLGLTVACARCHDHKFDAISTKDYYALFGVLESSNYRLARFDTITHNRKVAEELAKFREESRKPIQDALAKAMAPTMAKLDAYLVTAGGIEDRAKGLDAQLLQRWKVALGQALKNEMSPLHPFAKVAAEKNRPVQEVLAPIRKRWLIPQSPAFANADIVVDHVSLHATDLLADDVAFGLRPVRAGEMILGLNPSRPIARIVELGAAERDRAMDGLRLAAGSQNESGSLGGAQRSGRTLRTPEFTLKHGKAFAYVKGNGMIYAGVGQHIMLAGPLHGRLVQKFNTGDKFQWVAIDLLPYKGQRAHLEFTPNEGANFALAIVVQAESMPAPPTGLSAVAILADCTMGAQSIVELARLYQGVVQQVPLVLSLEKVNIKHGDDPAASFSSLTNWAVQNADLFIVPGSEAEQAIAKVAAPILAQQKKLLAQLKLDSRLTPAMQDGSGTDEFVFTRGNPKTLGPQVPRRFLEALAGAKAMPIKSGSGRLELAQQMTDPAVTPFITRVYVNRVWHHLFGRGIVGTVDNFGVLGEAPTHPELLDHVADKFARDGWSTKKLIRALVLTNAYQMASTPDAKADEADPGNLLLHRMRLRRLEGEAIRDSILKVSGRLNNTMYGPSVPVYLTPFQDGRGRPGSGLLDGDGRRSVYMSVRRNFLSSFLLAFDTPSPFSTVGRRTNSNVPAQALILMNDPFVHSQANVWAKRVTAEKGTVEERVRGMYLDAFARPPSETELKACIGYLGATPDLRRWADLGHVLINTKEFYFAN
ncbi:MAG: DUF1553 domain-containing protein [Gemmataceae bacterium]|nr:DUF1553 domain-containing protein [Gemmataceae bacterium]